MISGKGTSGLFARSCSLRSFMNRTYPVRGDFGALLSLRGFFLFLPLAQPPRLVLCCCKMKWNKIQIEAKTPPPLEGRDFSNIFIRTMLPQYTLIHLSSSVKFKLDFSPSPTFWLKLNKPHYQKLFNSITPSSWDKWDNISITLVKSSSYKIMKWDKPHHTKSSIWMILKHLLWSTMEFINGPHC